MTSDHDLLIRLDERVQKLDRCMTNHLSRHQATTRTLIGTLIAAIGSLLTALGTLAAVLLRGG